MSTPRILFWILPPVAACAGFFLAPAPTLIVPGADTSVAAGDSSSINGASRAAGGENGSQSYVATGKATSQGFSSEVLQEVFAHRSPSMRAAAAADLFEGLEPFEYAFALRKLVERYRAEGDQSLIPVFFQAWMRRDLQTAARGALELDDPTLRNAACVIVARAWARQDLAAANKWASENLQGLSRQSFEMYAKRLADEASGVDSKAQAAAERLEDVLAVSDNRTRSSRLRAYFTRKADADPAAAAAELARVSSQDRWSLAHALAESWNRRDPVAGFRWFVSKDAKNLELDPGIASRFIEKIVENDLQRGYDLLRELDLSDPKTHTTAQSFLLKAHTKDPNGVAALLEDPRFQRPDFPDRYGVLALKDGPAAFQLALKEYNPEAEDRTGQRLQLRALRSVVMAMRSDDPAAAAALIAAAPQKFHADLYSDVGMTWCRRDARAAAQWAEAQPAGVARDAAMREFTYLWAKSDSNAAAGWLNRVAPGSSRNEAILGFSVATIDTDPDGVLAWTRSVPDQERRDFILGRAWTLWMERNSRAASDWLNQSGPLQEAERTAIREHKY